MDSTQPLTLPAAAGIGVAALAAFDVAAVTWGVDSREGLSDDRVR